MEEEEGSQGCEKDTDGTKDVLDRIAKPRVKKIRDNPEHNHCEDAECVKLGEGSFVKPRHKNEREDGIDNKISDRNIFKQHEESSISDNGYVEDFRIDVSIEAQTFYSLVFRRKANEKQRKESLTYRAPGMAPLPEVALARE
jgi:hypothetical protein